MIVTRRLLARAGAGPMTKTRHTIILLAGLFAIFHITSLTAQTKAPFVASFERFARHAEVEEVLAGEILLSELSCTACHASGRISAKGGPQLDSVARRVSEQWLRDYLTSPATAKPGTTMPDVLSGLTPQSKDEAITALVAFLSTLQADFPTLKAGGANPVEFEFWKKGDADRGARFYHQLGCVACHAPDADYDVAEIAASPIDRLLDELDPDELAEMGLASTARRVESVPLGDLALKYSLHSLTRFLFQPEHFRPSGRMPNMKLAPDEAADIAAYLRQRRKPLPDLGPDGAEVVKTFESGHSVSKLMPSSAPGGPDDRMISPSTNTALVENGRQLFSTLGCANCHSAGEIVSQRFKPLEELNLTATSASCLVEGAGSVTYGLDSVQAAALNVAINVAKIGPTTHSQIEGSELAVGQAVVRTLLQMNCYACHTRDDLGGVGRYRRGYFETVTGADLGDEGRLPPPLSGIGRKLKPTWLKRVFRGDPETTLRPHMTIRMPTFPHADVTALADLLGKVDGANPAPASQVFANSTAGTEASSTGTIGRDLIGIGCIECHAFEGQAMPGVIGVDLTNVPERVFPSWFLDFILNPGQIKSRTRMPSFFPDGKSQVPQTLGGDATKQIAAMWDYLEHHDQFGLPGKIAAERAKNYQLSPTDHPLMLRTFMNGVGLHAIAVGFPEGVHFAVDASEARLAIGWRKEFVDARSTWFERFTPLIDPLGCEVQPIDKGPSFFNFDPLDEVPVAVPIEFLGYQLDSVRVPTFQYRCGDYRIEDRIVPDASDGLRRRLRLLADSDGNGNGNGNGNADELWFRVIEGDQVSQPTKQSFRNQSGLTVQVHRSNQTPLYKSQWIIPLHTSEDLELIYQW